MVLDPSVSSKPSVVKERVQELLGFQKAPDQN
jgi:hypothetical protein